MHLFGTVWATAPVTWVMMEREVVVENLRREQQDANLSKETETESTPKSYPYPFDRTLEISPASPTNIMSCFVCCGHLGQSRPSGDFNVLKEDGEQSARTESPSKRWTTHFWKDCVGVIFPVMGAHFLYSAGEINYARWAQ